jgi:hypothetical protein
MNGGMGMCEHTTTNAQEKRLLFRIEKAMQFLFRRQCQDLLRCTQFHTLSEIL